MGQQRCDESNYHGVTLRHACYCENFEIFSCVVGNEKEAVDFSHRPSAKTDGYFIWV